MKKIFYLSLILIITVGCNNTQNERDKYISGLREKSKRVKRISEKFNAERQLDTLYFPTTHEFNEYIRENDTYLIQSYIPLDVIQFDSIFHFHIMIGLPAFSVFGDRATHYLDLKCDKKQVNTIFENFPDTSEKIDSLVSDAFLIVKLNEVEKIKSKSFNFKGNLIHVEKE